ncbi:hypothetical protein DMUE_1716 [Dictyocoela muelleri]|nr:hypothetical protein DMUE_1716 [Dictyocoela muelleri]
MYIKLNEYFKRKAKFKLKDNIFNNIDENINIDDVLKTFKAFNNNEDEKLFSKKEIEIIPKKEKKFKENKNFLTESNYEFGNFLQENNSENDYRNFKRSQKKFGIINKEGIDNKYKYPDKILGNKTKFENGIREVFEYFEPEKKMVINLKVKKGMNSKKSVLKKLEDNHEKINLEKLKRKHTKLKKIELNKKRKEQFSFINNKYSYDENYLQPEIKHSDKTKIKVKNQRSKYEDHNFSNQDEIETYTRNNDIEPFKRECSKRVIENINTNKIINKNKVINYSKNGKNHVKNSEDNTMSENKIKYNPSKNLDFIHNDPKKYKKSIVNDEKYFINKLKGKNNNLLYNDVLRKYIGYKNINKSFICRAIAYLINNDDTENRYLDVIYYIFLFSLI